MEKLIKKIETDVKMSERSVSECQRLYCVLTDWVDKYASTQNDDCLYQARKILHRMAEFSVRSEAAVTSAASYFTTYRFCYSPELYDKAFKELVAAREAFQDVDGWFVEATRYLDERVKA